ncbi:MAG: hypothetical protein IPJ93_05070 [Bacteroidota bacterium]|nr:MAG: hypothetical protein IPJ93_05070 [Bacteroidota bacterium]
MTFLFLKFVIRCIAFLDLRILYLLADGIAFCFKYIFPYRKKVILQNLYNSFPEKSEQEIEEIAKQFYNYFANLIVETIKMSSISKKNCSDAGVLQMQKFFIAIMKKTVVSLPFVVTSIIGS